MRGAAVVACVLALGCRTGANKSEAALDAGADAASASARDAPILELAKTAAACSAEGGVFDPKCAGVKAWTDARDAFAEGKGDRTLVGMLTDPDEKIRYLASFKLNQFGRSFATDRDLASAVVSAAEQERSPFPAFELGSTVGRISLRATGTFERVRSMVIRHALPDLRRGILTELLFHNPGDASVFELARDTVHDADKAVAMAALRSFWTGGSTNPDGTCQVYVDHVDSANEELAAEASNALAWFGKCAARYDKLLAALELRVRSGPTAFGEPGFATAARHLCEDPKATDAQRNRAADVGRAGAKRADLKLGARLAALEAAWRCDPSDAGKAFVTKFKGDPDKALADKAKELLAKK